MPKINFCKTAILPTEATARRYGMTLAEWVELLESQGNVCAICKKLPPSGRLVVDHQHVPKWRKMPPTERRKYVRGILCSLCNGKCASRHMTTFKALMTFRYFQAHDERIELEQSKRQQSGRDAGAPEGALAAANRKPRRKG